MICLLVRINRLNNWERLLIEILDNKGIKYIQKRKRKYKFGRKAKIAIFWIVDIYCLVKNR
jgi:hypothetical protein